MPKHRLSYFISALIIAVGAAVAPYPSLAAARPALSSTEHRASTARSAVAASPVGLRREVFGFALASSLSDPTVGYPSWKFSVLGTVSFFALHVNSSGGIDQDSSWNVWNSTALTGLLNTAHAAGTKVVVTIDLQDFAPGTPSMCAGLVNRAVTVNQAVAQVAAKGVDGVNVDYEGLNGTCPNGETSRAMLTAFIQQLRGALPSGSYLSIDTYASSAADPLGFFDVPSLNQFVDAFFVMAYDLEYSNWHHAPLYCASFCLSPTAPLSGYYYNDTSTVAQYVAAVPASKVILGVPYYGRKSCVGGTGPNQYPTSSVIADSYLDASGEGSAAGVQPGSYILHRDANDPAGQEPWATWTNTTLGCTRQLYWDDVQSLAKKYDLVNQDGLRGVGIWTLNYGGGASELWSTLQSHFVGCTSVSESANPTPPVQAGTLVTITASGMCPNASPEYEFWILSPGASLYTLVQAYSPSTTLSWNTASDGPGTYRINVWVKDSSGQGVSGNPYGRWDAYNANLTYTLTPHCPSVTESAAPATTAPIGSMVTFSAAAGGCPSPLYEFWILSPGASLYALVQPYGTSSTFNWTTGSNGPGTYRINVWVRQAGGAGLYGNSYGRWDAYNSSLLITLTASCSAVVTSVSPSTTVKVGSAVAIKAVASGCANPTYEFWILSPGATGYSLVQAYSTTPSFTWATAGNGPGTYRITVWVRDASSPGVFGNPSGRWDSYNANLLVTLSR